jgi:hypothetical protein
MQTTRYGLKSLPTYYKGVTFRSRLEARWAIVFDELGIKWEYEPEGIEINASHFSDPYNPKSFGYLPDFYFPDLDCMVEVKGSLTKAEYWKLMRTIWQVTGGFDRECGAGMRFVLCGNLGNHSHYPMVKYCFNYKGEIYASPFADIIESELHQLRGAPFEFATWVGSDSTTEEEIEGEVKHTLISDITEYLCNSIPFPVRSNSNYQWDLWHNAIDKARSARFQDGHHA